MEDINSFTARIDAVLAEERRQVAQFQEQQTQLYHDRLERLDRYEEEIRQLVPIIAPRLRALAERFKDAVHVEPIVRAHAREIEFSFRSELAKIRLKFGAYPDAEVRNIIFQYDLDIIPILLKFDSQSTLQQPLDNIDTAAVVKWLDDRIVDFVKIYVAIYENKYYLQGQQVKDPIAGISFPKHFAASTLDWKGKTYHFISHETREEFEKRHSISTKEIMP